MLELGEALSPLHICFASFVKSIMEILHVEFMLDKHFKSRLIQAVFKSSKRRDAFSDA